MEKYSGQVFQGRSLELRTRSRRRRLRMRHSADHASRNKGSTLWVIGALYQADLLLSSGRGRPKVPLLHCLNKRPSRQSLYSHSAFSPTNNNKPSNLTSSNQVLHQNTSSTCDRSNQATKRLETYEITLFSETQQGEEVAASSVSDTNRPGIHSTAAETNCCH